MPEIGPVGGARPGAGRPRRTQRFAGEIKAAEAKLAVRLPDLLDLLLSLAQGGIEQVEERWAPSEATGEMVLVERRVTYTLPDRAVLEYLTNRILGKPVSKSEIALHASGEPIKFYAGVDIDRV